MPLKDRTQELGKQVLQRSVRSIDCHRVKGEAADLQRRQRLETVILRIPAAAGTHTCITRIGLWDRCSQERGRAHL